MKVRMFVSIMSKNEVITRKSEVKEKLVYCFAVYKKDGLDACIKVLNERLPSRRVKFSLLEYVGIQFFNALPPEEHISLSRFKACKIDYLLPATVTLLGIGRANSKTLMLNAIRKHYPYLEQRYLNYFKTVSQMPRYYQKGFYKKMKELCETHGLRDKIV